MTYVNTFGTPASAYESNEDGDDRLAKGVIMLVCAMLMGLLTVALIVVHLVHLHRLKTEFTPVTGVVTSVRVSCVLDYGKSQTPMSCARAEALKAGNDYYFNAGIAYEAAITYQYRPAPDGSTYRQTTTRRVNAADTPRPGQPVRVYVNKADPAVSEYGEGGVGL